MIALLAFAILTGSPGVQSPAVAQALSFGQGHCGKLQGGVALPCRGPNFSAFSKAACAMGRNYLHPLVQSTVVDAFKALEIKGPKRTWQYGEMGKASGGSLWPHKTHQNGLSADFFMPVVNQRGEPDQVPISALNKFGYNLEFDRRGKLDDLTIDWKAIADHLLALVDAGQAHGVRIERILRFGQATACCACSFFGAIQRAA